MVEEERRGGGGGIVENDPSIRESVGGRKRGKEPLLFSFEIG